MKRPQAVIVHGLGHAGAALAQGQPVILLSAPGAGWHAGAAWWRALTGAARALHPATPCQDYLDCGDYAGAAMAALRLGQPGLVLCRSCPAFATIAAIAEGLGSTLLAEAPPALDFAQPDALHRLRAWLATNPDAMK